MPVELMLASEESAEESRTVRISLPARLAAGQRDEEATRQRTNPFFRSEQALQGLGGGGDGGDRGSGLGGGDRESFGRVYAAVEVPEPGGEDVPEEEDQPLEPILLECVDATWFDAARSNMLAWDDIAFDAPLSVLALDSFPKSVSLADFQPGDIAWFQVEYQKAHENESDARVFATLLGDG